MLRKTCVLLFFLPLIAWAHKSTNHTKIQTPACSFVGEVSFGQQYTHSIGNNLNLVLDPLPSGWLVRVLPVGQPRPAHDYAELATPPYQSVTPLAVSTDFSFRAQDAVGWNPRHFQYAGSAAAFRELLASYERYMTSTGNDRLAAEQRLTVLVQKAVTGTFQILDARLTPGSADQTGTAAMVASHYAETAHQTVPDGRGANPALGGLHWIKFNVQIGGNSASGCH